jgi:hypothetical protein
MTDTLSELLHRSADAVPDPRVDVAALVAEAGHRERRRRVALAATAVAVVGTVATVSLVVRSDRVQEIEPAPSPPPSPPGTLAVDPAGTRPLVYAEGSVVHVGDETFDAGGAVKLLEVTDDGVAFVIEDDRRPQLWFHDDASTVMIGLLDWTTEKRSYAPRRVETSPSGSLVVWKQSLHGDVDVPDEYVVYDTARHEQVARIPATGGSRDLRLVSDDALYFGSGPHVRRYDVAAGTTAVITRPAMDAELAGQARFFRTVTQSGVVMVSAEPRFEQVGRNLVAKTYDDSQLRSYVDVRLSDGERLQLRLPDGYQVPGDDEVDNRVSYWLDDDHVVIGAGDGAGDVDPFTGDLLVCRLPDGVCRVAQRDVIGVGQRY